MPHNGVGKGTPAESIHGRNLRAASLGSDKKNGIKIEEKRKRKEDGEQHVVERRKALEGGNILITESPATLYLDAPVAMEIIAISISGKNTML